MTRPTVYFAAALMAASLTAPASAVTLFDTGTPSAMGFGLGGGNGQQLAALVPLAQNSKVTSIQGYLDNALGPATVTISVYGNGPLPGSEIFSGDFVMGSPSAENWRGLFGLNLDLAAGNYWIGFSSSGPGPRIGFDGTANPALAQAYLNSGTGYAWTTSTLPRIGVRLLGTVASPPAVPEPASWALLIAGFGLAGVAMRRQAARPGLGLTPGRCLID
jgi:hypothetical protein